MFQTMQVTTLRIAILLWLSLSLTTLTKAQARLSYGFKAGLNSSTLDGPLLDEENYESSIGFHLGIIFRYAFTDLFGAKGEFMYSQKGGKYSYDGTGPFYLQRAATNSIILTGNRQMNINISNDYLDFPILLYGRFGNFEINGGFNLGILVSSAGGGQLTYDSTDPDIDPITFNLDHRYFGDEAREAIPLSSQTIRFGSEDVVLAKTVGGYYEYESKGGNLYNRFDFGLNAGLSLFLNEGLYLGFRANFGISDVTNKDADITYKTFDGNSPALQNDADKQTSYQFSLGFSF